MFTYQYETFLPYTFHVQPPPSPYCLAARRDKYQPDVKKYWIEKEVEGTYEKEVKRASTRRLNIDMNSEDFEDNDTFGAIDGESDCRTMSDNSDEESEDPSPTGSESTSDGKSRKRKSHERKRRDRKDRDNKRRRSRDPDEVSVEEPLEASLREA